MFAMSAHTHSKARAIPVLWLLAWSSFQPLISGQTPPLKSKTCSSESGSSCMQHEGVSLLQSKSQVAKMDVSPEREVRQSQTMPRKRSFPEDCTICKEIEKEVQSQVKTEVSTIMKKAKVTIEKEFLRHVLMRHNSTMKELERIVEKQVTADLKNTKKIETVEKAVQENFVNNGEVKEMNTELEEIESRLTIVEKEIKEIESTIKDIKGSVTELESETKTFVKTTTEKITELVVLIKKSSSDESISVLNKVVKIIQEKTTEFSKTILQETDRRITESVSTTLVKVENIVQEAINREREHHITDDGVIEERITENWKKTTTIIKELKEAITEATESQVKNQKEITAVKESIESIVIAIAQKVVGEHSAIAEGSLEDLTESLEDLAATVEEESEVAREREMDIEMLKELMIESETRIVQKTEESIKTEAEIMIQGTTEAIEKLKLDLGKVTSSKSSQKSKMEKLMKELTIVKEDVEAGKEERIKNTQDISVLKKDSALVKEMVNELKADLEKHKESTSRQTLEEVKILLESAQKSTIEKARELSVKEMTTEINLVKESLETKLTSTIVIMQEGHEEEQLEHEEHQKKLEDKLESLKKQIKLNTNSNEKIAADQDELKDVVKQLEVVVDMSKEEHEMTNSDIKELMKYVELVSGDVQKHKGEMASSEDLERLEAAVTKVNAKVISVSDKMDKETKVREMSVKALEERVTANEDHILELEEEISGMKEQVMDIREIMREINEEQAGVKDKAVKAALKAVESIVQETTESVIKDGMLKVREETKVMINQVTKTVAVLKTKMASEHDKRVLADEQLSILQKKIVSLTAAMEQKADASTIQKVSETVGMIQSTVRSEKEVRVEREKTTLMIKQAMVSLFRRTEITEKEVQTIKETHDVHHIHHVIKTESTESITKVSTKVAELEAAASAELARLKADISAANEQLAADEAARLQSDAALKVLQEMTMELFKKVASNSDKVAMLDSKLTEQIDTLSQSLSEVTIKMQVSEEASRGDQGRIQKMLTTLVADLSAEEGARRSGDLSLEKTIMSRVQVLIEEMTAVSKSISSSSSSKTHCACKTIVENGKADTVCTQDGKVVESCAGAVEGFDINSIKGGSSMKTSTGGSSSGSSSGGSSSGSSSSSSSSKTSSSSSSSSSKTGCRCEMTFKGGDFKEICKKGGKVVSKAECGELPDSSGEMSWENLPTDDNSVDAGSLEDLMKKHR